MKVAVDAIAASHPQPGGYQTYTVNLLKHLAQVDRSNEYVVFFDRVNDFNTAPGWETVIVPSHIPFVGVAFREQVALPWYVNRAKIDVVHFPCSTGSPFTCFPCIVTLYDTIEFSVPLPSPHQFRFWAMRLYSRYIQSAMVRRAEQIITISSYSKSRIVDRFHLPPEQVAVTYLAPAAHICHIDKQKARDRIQRDFGFKNYVLALASASPRKNIPRLLEAFAQLPGSLRMKFPLLIVCTHELSRPILGRQIEELHLEEDVRLLTRVSDSVLNALYNAASLFVFPSLEEGFGLPPLEAMVCGTPVVASNTSSLPEIMGDAALLIPPTRTEAIADAILRVLTDSLLAKDLCQRGLQRSRLFSWERTARETMAVYEQALGNLRSR